MRHLNTRSLRLLGASILVAGVGTFATSVSAFALSGSGATGGLTSGCSGTPSGGSCTLTFIFTLAGGAPACNTTVDFTVSGISTATITPSGTVDCNTGNVQALFSAGSGCGTATITATDTTTLASVQTTDVVACLTGTPLPNTSALPPGNPPVWGGLAGLAALIVAGGGVALRRMRSVV